MLFGGDTVDLIWRSPSGTQCGQDKTHGLSEHACSLHTPNPSTQSTPGLTTVDTMVYHYSHTRLPTLPPRWTTTGRAYQTLAYPGRAACGSWAPPWLTQRRCGWAPAPGPPPSAPPPGSWRNGLCAAFEPVGGERYSNITTMLRAHSNNRNSRA